MANKHSGASKVAGAYQAIATAANHYDVDQVCHFAPPDEYRESRFH